MSDNTEGQQAVLERTREDLETLARWMGAISQHEVGDMPCGASGMSIGEGRSGDLLLVPFERGSGRTVYVKPATAFNPFTDANADVQVLLRAHEVLDHDGRRRLGRELERLWLVRFDARPAREDEPSKALQILLALEYLPGDYARAVLAVLRAALKPPAPAECSICRDLRVRRAAPGAPSR